MTKPIKCIYVSDGLLSPLGVILKVLTRKPVIASIHGRDIAFKLRIYQIIISWALQQLDNIICVSEELKKECLKRGVPNKILHVIPNGVDIEDFEIKEDFSKEKLIEDILGISIKNKKILLTVGRLVPKKGIDVFISNTFPKIIAQNPNIIYLIVGKGPLENEIKSLIKQYKFEEKIFLLGTIPMDSGLLASIYSLSDLFIMPNIPVSDDMEGFGIVALEAGAAGLPVIASRIDGITEAVKDGENGFLINLNDYTRYTDVILNLLHDEERRKEFGQKAKAYVSENYAWPNIAKQYLNQLEDLIKR